ncbi:MAG TPA: hypothetical protein VJ869_16120 [Sphaerochaeta sp.]|nr:hypothetical protein [Sphaerochaeta sp.]
MACKYCDADKDVAIYDDCLAQGNNTLRLSIAEGYGADYGYLFVEEFSGNDIVQEEAVEIQYCPMCGRKL